MNAQITIPGDRLASFCEERGIRRLAVYGSALREDFGPESDIDVLVEFEPDRIPGLIALAGMELDFRAIFPDHKADMRTAEDLSRHFRQDVLNKAEVLYEQE